MGQEEQPSDKPQKEDRTRWSLGKWLLIFTVIPPLGCLALTLLMFAGYRCTAVQFNSEFPINTAKLTDTHTLEVYAFHAKPECIVLATSSDSLETSEELEKTTFELTQDKLKVGPYELVPEQWWCRPDAGLDMPENTLDTTM